MVSVPEDEGRLTSLELASLIVDALLRGAILKPEHVEKAISITNEEIEARKAMGDY
jgi:hypothetical protein